MMIEVTRTDEESPWAIQRGGKCLHFYRTEAKAKAVAKALRDHPRNKKFNRGTDCNLEQ